MTNRPDSALTALVRGYSYSPGVRDVELRLEERGYLPSWLKLGELVTLSAGALPAPVDAEVLSVTYEHRDNKERHTVSVTRAEVIEHMDEQLFVKLTDKFCECEAIGETNVVECRCNEYTEEFELVPDAGAASTTTSAGEVTQLQASLAQVQADHAEQRERTVRACQVAIERSQQKKAAEAELIRLKAQRVELESVVKLAREFVKNGIELGYITMPDDDTPDPAHDLLPRMDAVLSGQFGSERS